MKPMHATLTRLRRCPCCQSNYSKHYSGKRNDGKSAARRKAKNDLKKEIRGD